MAQLIYYEPRKLGPTFPSSHLLPVPTSQSSPFGYFCTVLPISFMACAFCSSCLCPFLWTACSSCSLPSLGTLLPVLSLVAAPAGRVSWASGLWWGYRVDYSPWTDKVEKPGNSSPNWKLHLPIFKSKKFSSCTFKLYVHFHDKI